MKCQILFSRKNKENVISSRRQFAGSVRPYFLGNTCIRKLPSVCCAIEFAHSTVNVNPRPAEPGYTLPLQTVQIQINWLPQKPTDLDLHCLS